MVTSCDCGRHKCFPDAASFLNIIHPLITGIHQNLLPLTDTFNTSTHIPQHTTTHTSTVMGGKAKFAAIGGRTGGTSHHCIKGCTATKTQVCIRKGHKGWCKRCGSFTKLTYPCSGCGAKGAEWFQSFPTGPVPTADCPGEEN